MDHSDKTACPSLGHEFRQGFQYAKQKSVSEVNIHEEIKKRQEFLFVLPD